jgi:hypothetical protein
LRLNLLICIFGLPAFSNSTHSRSQHISECWFETRQFIYI